MQIYLRHSVVSIGVKKDKKFSLGGIHGRNQQLM